tara:strand:+ start:1424 stop:1849 length:426 start_codon:yes stop_codon:yes gene_type:complete
MNLKVDFAAGGIVLDNNKILLVKNRKNEYVDNPKSFWGFPKGHLQDGEAPKDAAKREVLEETGFIVELMDKKPLVESRYEIFVNKEKVKKTVWFFKMNIVKAFDNEPDNEIEEVALVDYETALDLLTHEEDKKILKYVFDK